jgi:Alginate export
VKSGLAWWLNLGLSLQMLGIALGQQTQPAVPSPQQVAGRETPPTSPSSKAARPQAPKHKLGPFDISVSWRTRTEGWNWFQGTSGNSDYPFWDSTLRIGVGQEREGFDWFAEGEQPSIVGLPTDAVEAAPQGQLGLGGTYYAANGNESNNASFFLKQGFVRFKRLGGADAKLGRFEYFDGTEVKPADPLLAAVVQTRIAHRLISNFGFTAVQRTFDGAQLAFNFGRNNVTLFGARPTVGIFQIHGMDELDVDIYYGAFTRSFSSGTSASQLRVFAAGYVDDRHTVLKTDNRSQSDRAADGSKIEIATYGADYAQVFNTAAAGKFDFFVWGVLQGGSWGTLRQRAGAFVGEFGWQPAVKILKPWISAGYSYGSGDGNPTDSRHGTFFQLLTTPRQYARFPFYNMMNNEDGYATLNVSPTRKLVLRSEAHLLRLTNAADLWYQGGGAFQPKTFGYTGRPSGGYRSFANVWDLSADYQFTSSFSATLYYGHSWGRSVIKNIYPTDANAQLAFLETNFHF